MYMYMYMYMYIYLYMHISYLIVFDVYLSFAQRIYLGMFGVSELFQAVHETRDSNYPCCHVAQAIFCTSFDRGVQGDSTVRQCIEGTIERLRLVCTGSGCPCYS